MKVTLINFTPDAVETLIFTKRTRLMSGASAWSDVFDLPENQKMEEVLSIFDTIDSPLEFVDYTFLISDVTRAFTHQLVRSRIGTSFAQQSQRTTEMRDFGFENTCKTKTGRDTFANLMDLIQEGYVHMVDYCGEGPQDARGALPTNIHTNICFKINLRAMKGLMGLRMCFRTQGEYQNVALQMRDEVLRVHPWAEPCFLPVCLQTGACAFPRFDECPLKVAFPLLQPFYGWSGAGKLSAKDTWKENIGKEFQPVAKFAGEK